MGSAGYAQGLAHACTHERWRRYVPWMLVAAVNAVVVDVDVAAAAAVFAAAAAAAAVAVVVIIVVVVLVVLVLVIPMRTQKEAHPVRKRQGQRQNKAVSEPYYSP
eukprot:366024-Chlamydomonas_euryale.AAC.17